MKAAVYMYTLLQEQFHEVAKWYHIEWCLINHNAATVNICFHLCTRPVFDAPIHTDCSLQSSLVIY